VLIGRWNWWPSALSRARPTASQATPATPPVPPDGGPDASFTKIELLLKLPTEDRGVTRGTGPGVLAEPTRGHA
jgi:hypothetical protein